MNKSELSAEIERLKNAIRNHRDQKGDDRCWMDDQELYAVLGDGNLGDNTIGDPKKMLRNCEKFIAVRCQPGSSWIPYAELLEQNNLLIKQNEELKSQNALMKKQIAEILF